MRVPLPDRLLPQRRLLPRLQLCSRASRQVRAQSADLEPLQPRHHARGRREAQQVPHEAHVEEPGQRAPGDSQRAQLSRGWDLQGKISEAASFFLFNKCYFWSPGVTLLLVVYVKAAGTSKHNKIRTHFWTLW